MKTASDELYVTVFDAFTVDSDQWFSPRLNLESVNSGEFSEVLCLRRRATFRSKLVSLP